MKKIIGAIILFVTTFSAQNAFSQAQIAIGLKGGLNFASVNTDDVKASARTGYHVGAFALIKLTKIGIQPEIIFSQQGAKVKDPVLSKNVEDNFSYINIPVILKLYTVAGINIQAGPQFGFLASAKHDGDDIKEDFKSSDISLALGLGWDLPFGLTLDGRYNWGLTNVSDSGDVKNQVWQVSVGYKLFKLGN